MFEFWKKLAQPAEPSRPVAPKPRAVGGKTILQTDDPRFENMVRCDYGIQSKKEDVTFLFDVGDTVVVCTHGRIKGEGKVLGRKVLPAATGGFCPMYHVERKMQKISYYRQNELACKAELLPEDEDEE